MVCTKHAKHMPAANKENRIISFLLRLNVEFDHVTIQILRKTNSLPIMKYLLFSEEKRVRGL